MQQHEDPSLFLEEESRIYMSQLENSRAAPDTSVVLTPSCLTALVSLSFSVFFQGRILEARVPSALAPGLKAKYKRLGRKQCLPVVTCFSMVLAKQNKKELLLK